MNHVDHARQQVIAACAAAMREWTSLELQARAAGFRPPTMDETYQKYAEKLGAHLALQELVSEIP